ncbi:MAG: adenylate/guanylate cyclase domain-containing protein [Pseudomonadota bacterium]
MEQASVKRRLVAILAADVAGYSRLMGADEEGTHARLKAHLDALVDPQIAAHRGRIVKTTGDGVLVEFDSVVDAMRAAVDIQRGMVERNAELAEERRILFRMGINVGDVIIDGDDIYGDGVNVAARLQALAAPGQICVSRAVRDQVRDKLEFSFADLGEHAVKNIARPVKVHRLVYGGDLGPPARRLAGRRRLGLAVAATAIVAVAGGLAWYLIPRTEPAPAVAVSEAPRLSLSDRPSIAVLPLVNQSGDPAQDYFSDGITDDIIAALGRFSNLAVIARNAVYVYKGKPVQPESLGRELDVRYLVEGSVRRAGNRIRVTVQLTDAMRGLHLWSERYDGEITDVFAVQEEIARGIVATLAVKLTRLEQERAFAKPTENLAAYDYVLRGRKLNSDATRSANIEARQMFEQAIRLDPAYAAAYAGLGWVQYETVTAGWTEFADNVIEEAEALARKALSLDDTLAAAYRLLGFIHLTRRQYDKAIAELNRAIEINPSDAESHGARGAVLIWSGYAKEAKEALETALRFDPSLGRGAHMNLGFVYYLMERYEDAIRFLERGVPRDPGRLYVWYSHIGLAAAYAQSGRLDDAGRAKDTVLQLGPFFQIEPFVAQFQNPTHRAHFRDGLRNAGLE